MYVESRTSITRRGTMPITTLKRSVTGANHVRQQVRCQDAGKTLVFKDFTVMAVADGHGSARCPFSDTGSKIAVNVFCDGVPNVYRKQPGKTEFRRFFEEKGDKPFAKAIVQEWRRRVARAHAGKIRTKKASGSSENLDEIAMLYGSTLLGIVITKDFFYVFQIGDGNIIYIENGTLRELTMGEKMLGVETNSLALSAPWKYVCTKVYDTTEPRVVPNMFLLATDGFANSYLNQKEFYKGCKEYYQAINLYGEEKVSKNLRNWLMETSRMGCGDDITVAIAHTT